MNHLQPIATATTKQLQEALKPRPYGGLVEEDVATVTDEVIQALTGAHDKREAVNVGLYVREWLAMEGFVGRGWMLARLRSLRRSSTSYRVQRVLVDVFEQNLRLPWLHSLWYALRARMDSLLFSEARKVESSISNGPSDGQEPSLGWGAELRPSPNVAAYFRDLPSLLTTHRGWSAVYHQGKRVALHQTRRRSEEFCVKQKIPFDQVLIQKVMPEQTEYVA